jgi:hypothetical protein
MEPINPTIPTDTKRVAKVSATGPTTLHVEWKEGGGTDVDLSGWIARGAPITDPLREPAVFDAPRIIDYGAAIAWTDDDDLAIDATHIRILAEPQRTMTPADMQAWQAGLGISNREAAELLGIAQSTWNAYKAGSATPATAVQIACRALAQDGSLFTALYRPRKAAGRPKKAA